MFKMHFLKNYSMYNNEIWHCVKKHSCAQSDNPMEQIITVRPSMVMELQYLKISDQKSFYLHIYFLFKQFRQ